MNLSKIHDTIDCLISNRVGVNMAHATIYLTNGVEVKPAPVGFSWTMFFWGFFPPLFRQDWLWGIVLFIASVFIPYVPSIICSFFYNKVYIKSLIDKGYKIKDMPGVTEDYLKNYLGYVELPKA